uniref:Uncharacterized protein n=1 Tax=Rhizophagus irregularis (strain DAOM 181602 / DAOM 197198 / MUCL 43194) TaxID=747089 RepID=U9TJB9_RHIID
MNAFKEERNKIQDTLQIIACITDNTTNNDTLMSALEKTCQEKDALSNLKVGYIESKDEILNQNKEIVDVISKLCKLVIKILASSQR